MYKKIIDIYSYSYGNAAQDYGTEEGPSYVQKALKDKPSAFRWHAPLSVQGHKQQVSALPDVRHLNQCLAKLVLQSVMEGHPFVTLGGDHSCAIGSWSGAAAAIQNHGELGLIWFDAHMDAHTPETTLSNNLHGMPLAVLLGQGDRRLTQLLSAQAKLNPRNVALIGARSYESGEAALLKERQIKIFDMQDIADKGMSVVLTEAVRHVTQHSYRFGISIDLDGFDPVDAPGVGTIEVNGVNAKAFLSAFPMITQHPQFIGMEITEFNPSLDQENKTLSLVLALLSAINARKE